MPTGHDDPAAGQIDPGDDLGGGGFHLNGVVIGLVSSWSLPCVGGIARSVRVFMDIHAGAAVGRSLGAGKRCG